MLRILIVAACCLLARPGFAADSPAPRVLHANAVAEGALVIDGQSSELAWNTAPRGSGFVQTSPQAGAPPSEQTTIRVLRSTKALYFFIEAHHSDPTDIRGFLTQRDVGSPSDWIEIWLSPQNDNRTGYHFAINARGVQSDARISLAGANRDFNWDAVWSSAVSQDESGWAAEVRIPLSQMRFDKRATEFGLQVGRLIASENEWSYFEPLPIGIARPLLHLARLRGLGELPQGGNLALRPFGLFRFEENAQGSLWEPQIGGDILYQPGGSTTIHATILPDFGQVEQDPSQLNLTAFEVFFAERRQFFLDGRENLLTPLAFRNFFQEQLYYSRRIGAPPTATQGVDHDDFTAYPTGSTIVGATKVLTRTKSGLSANLLSAFTERETAEFDDGGGRQRITVASPTSYNVGRIVQEVQDGRGFVSVSGTHAERFLDAELVEEQARRASTGSADFDLRFADLGLRGQIAGSHIEGSSDAVDEVQRSATNNRQRPDALHVDYDPEATALSGYSLALQGGKFDGNPWRASWGGRVRSPGFNTNDMGFLRLADQELFETSLEYRLNEPTQWYRAIALSTANWFEKSWGPEITSAGVSVHSDWHFANNWWGWLGGLRRVAAVDPRLLRGGPAMAVPGASGVWFGIHSDNRKKADAELRINGDLGNQDSLRRLQIALEGFFRPSGWLNFSASPSFETRLDDNQYVDTLTEAGIDQYYLGRLHQETYQLTLRASWAIALGLTLRVYAMPFITVGRYEHFYRVTDPRGATQEERREVSDYSGDEQFLTSQIRSSVVLRWDYEPGSSAYIVWTHEQGDSRSDVRGISPSRDAGELFTSEPVDVVMVKVNRFLPL